MVSSSINNTSPLHLKNNEYTGHMDEFEHLKEMLKDIDKCPECKAPWIPALDSVIFSGPRKGEWDGHTYKASCDHFPSNIRHSIG